MLDFDDIKVEFESQSFRCSHIGISPEKDKAVMFMDSTARVDSVICPYCQHSVRMILHIGDERAPRCGGFVLRVLFEKSGDVRDHFLDRAVGKRVQPAANVGTDQFRCFFILQKRILDGIGRKEI